MRDRNEIFNTLRTIIVDTRGVEEESVTSEANLFGDLGLESIDFLEISFRMEESFGFPFPTDDLGSLMGAVNENSTTEKVREVLGKLRTDFHIPVDVDNLPGLNPLDPKKLRSEVMNLFSVNALVEFVAARSNS